MFYFITGIERTEFCGDFLDGFTYVVNINLILQADRLHHEKFNQQNTQSFHLYTWFTHSTLRHS